MNNDDDSNYVSVWSWMWMLFILAIPGLGAAMILVWSFTGENQTRKNYFRAIIAWILVGTVLIIGLIVLAPHMPALQKYIHDWRHKP